MFYHFILYMSLLKIQSETTKSKNLNNVRKILNMKCENFEDPAVYNS